MSFRCDFCGEPQPNNVSIIKVVTKIRNRGNDAYEHRGAEIAEEKNFCAKCYDPEFQPELLNSLGPQAAIKNPVIAQHSD